MMKRFLLTLGLFASFAWAQPPDCSIFFNFTAVGRYPATGFNSGSLQTGCVGWILTYYSTGFTAVSLRLDSADDASGSPAAWGAFAGTVVSTTGCSITNPLTATTHGCLIENGANPWVSVNLQSVTGTGTIVGYAFGCRPDHCSALFGAGGGGGGSSGPACNLTVEVPLSGTGYVQLVSASGSTQVKVCNIVYGSATMAIVPVVNSLSLAFGNCSAGPTEAVSLPGITAYSDTFNGTLIGPAGAALCAKESVANSDKVTITYSQN